MTLVDTAQALQDEAQQLFEQLDLQSAFPWQPQMIGSALSGLMVQRDLDVMFDAPDATAAEVLSGLAVLARRVEILDLDFRDERGERRPTPTITDERFYTVLHTATWKVDLTFWLHVVDRPHVRDALRLRDAADIQRLAILELKDTCRDVDSTDIYDAVLRHGVQTRLELDDYLSAPR
jgi:hypothetical protein